MDCERFDKIVLELIYDELDELTAAAARRHTQQCQRCAGAEAGLRATREVGALPMLDVPDGFESRVLAEERNVRADLPLDQRASHWISVAAAYAMRPQLAMAALVMLMIGSGLILFRARPADRSDQELVEHVVQPAGHSEDGVVPVVSSATEGADDSVPATDLKHCEQDLKGMLETYDRYPSTSRGQASLWEAVHCQELMGDEDAAMANLRRLVSVDAFKDRATAKLKKLEAPALEVADAESEARAAAKPVSVAARKTRARAASKSSASANQPAKAEAKADLSRRKDAAPAGPAEGQASPNPSAPNAAPPQAPAAPSPTAPKPSASQETAPPGPTAPTLPAPTAPTPPPPSPMPPPSDDNADKNASPNTLDPAH